MLKDLLFLFFALALLNSCNRDNQDGTIIISEEIEEPQIVNNGSVFGKVVDEQLNSISGVRITTPESIKLSDEFGFFQITDQRFNKNGFLIHSEKSGYFDKTTTVLSKGNTTDNITLVLTRKDLPQTLKTNQSATLNIGHNIEIDIPANAFHNSDGTPYQGEIHLFSKWFNSKSDDFLEIIPRALSGINNSQVEVGIRSLGVLIIEVESSAGNKLFLNENMELLVSIPTSTIEQNNLPIKISTWHATEKFGKWIEGEESLLNVGSYEIKVKTLGNITIGQAYEQVYIQGKLISKDINEDKRSIPSSKIRITDLEGIELAYDVTDNDGYFSAHIPRNELNRIHIHDQCNLSIREEDLMNFVTDKNLGEFIVEVNTSSSSIIGSIFDCNGFSLKNAACMINNGDQLIAMTIEESENFELNIFDCNTADLNFYFIDLNNKSKSEIFEKTRDTYVNCNDIIVCDGALTSSVSFLLNGTPFTFDEVEIIEDHTNNFLFARIPMESDPTKSYFEIRLPLTEGNYTDEVYLQLVQLDNSDNILSNDDPLFYKSICLNQDTRCDVSLAITKVKDHIIEGNFIGTLDFDVNYPNNQIERESHNMSCTFSISR